ncbi:MAG TPA: CcoQ/FixQ family Cbb3-type cytochrome c oxidase assembly chaperone [Rubrivivax sp.]|nr:CcoQ/FixQ family Cbb3-type cytochrome c oxidase assembly chaperone [Rubrivivax sp.]
MDVNDLRILVMVLSLVLFLGIWAWAWSHKRKAAFDDAARLPFLDDEPLAGSRGEPQ